MRHQLSAFATVVCAMLLPLSAVPQDSAAPKGIQSEQSLPSRHPYVVRDILKFCKPAKGFWVDLGAGKGQIAIPLIEAAGNPVVMLDPNSAALAEGMHRLAEAASSGKTRPDDARRGSEVESDVGETHSKWRCWRPRY